MPIDTLITDVHGIAYLVLENEGGISYVPCEYDHFAHAAIFNPDEKVNIVTTQNLLPLEYHETEIRKLISVHQRVMVPAWLNRDTSDTTN